MGAYLIFFTSDTKIDIIRMINLAGGGGGGSIVACGPPMQVDASLNPSSTTTDLMSMLSHAANLWMHQRCKNISRPWRILGRLH